MSWLAENRLLLLFAGVVLTTLGAVGLTVVGIVATVGALLGGDAVVGTFAPFFLGALLFVGLDIVCAVALARELARRASVPRSRRVADGLRRVESVVPPLSALGLADRVAPPEPSFSDRHEELTRRYVEGEITEATYERELAALLDETDESVREGRETTAAPDPPEGAVRVESKTGERERAGDPERPEEN